jgi:predicted nucleic acid-binding protein
LRVFLDTNVLVAALATRGLCADVLRTVLAEHQLLLSGTVIEELTRTLTEKFRLPETMVREVVTFLHASASLANVRPQPPPVQVRDPDDAADSRNPRARSERLLGARATAWRMIREGVGETWLRGRGRDVRPRSPGD